MKAYRPVLLIILDGWGIREKEFANAVTQANTPNYEAWLRERERSILDASGEAVGLIPDQMGNSEVGHLNLGAGRIVYQDITRINKDIKENNFSPQTKLQEVVKKVKENKAKLHLVGLLGDGGVHSHDEHLYALLKFSAENDINPVLHVITDGRDTPPQSSIGFIKQLQEKLDETDVGRVATVSGRYYAMDRDKRWERTRQAFLAMTQAQSETQFGSALAGIEHAHQNDVTDEFIVPFVVEQTENLTIEAGDVVICYNFRADRMRQMTQLLSLSHHDALETGEFVDNLHILTMTEYQENLPVKVLYGKDTLKNTLAEVLSNNGLKQFHAAETEKYAHVTFFFNGRAEDAFAGETQKLIPSPKVATYDLQPEMSAYELADTVLERIQNEDDAFILVNFANPDMVGHTGDLKAATKAVETTDKCAGKLVEAVTQKGGIALVTADHGNAERMEDEITGEPHTYHTTSPVSFFAIGEPYFFLRPRGILADVAPTVLDLLGIKQPEEMTGRTLIEDSSDK